MSGAKLVPAAPGWWAVSVAMMAGGEWDFGPKVEIVAWHIEPVELDTGVEDFITMPVTIYGTVEGNFGVANSPAGKWYSPDVPGAFDSLEGLAAELMELFNQRAQRARKARANAN
jgi:hypothetical protein